MSREILEAMHALAREKGISAEKLIAALEDALLSAYKKQPGSAKYARVELDPETGDYRVIELIIPERLEAHLIVETIDEGTTYDPETGEMVEPTDYLELRAGAFEALAHVEAQAERATGWKMALERALAEHEAKGNLVMAARIRDQLVAGPPERVPGG